MKQIEMPLTDNRVNGLNWKVQDEPYTKSELDKVTRLRNLAWKNSPLIPKWVDTETVGLDQFFTRPEVASMCSKMLYGEMEADYADLGSYCFIEPGAGAGAFYDLMPPDRRIGIDIFPLRADFIQQDYLTWRPPDDYSKYAVLGNPPFGYRAWLALAFVNHSATFADYMGLILPMGFQSDGKGSPKHRVVGAQLVRTESLPPDAFVDRHGNSVKINALWQIWRRGVNNIPPVRTCNSWIDLFTVDIRKERLCGHERLDEAHYFLQRTYYGDPPELVRYFGDVRYGCGYGIVLKRDPEEIVRLLNATDWRKYSNLAMHNCRHISMYHIRQAVIDGGYTDD